MVDVAQLVESRIVIPVVVGSNPIVHPKYAEVARWPCTLCKSEYEQCSTEKKRMVVRAHLSALVPVAQLVEHLTENQGVAGSIPAGCTKFLWPCSLVVERSIRHFDTRRLVLEP
jgi:hypothetical protein